MYFLFTSMEAQASMAHVLQEGMLAIRTFQDILPREHTFSLLSVSLLFLGVTRTGVCAPHLPVCFLSILGANTLAHWSLMRFWSLIRFFSSCKSLAEFQHPLLTTTQVVAWGTWWERLSCLWIKYAYTWTVNPFIYCSLHTFWSDRSNALLYSAACKRYCDRWILSWHFYLKHSRTNVGGGIK